MSYMKINVRGKSVDIPVRDAVRVSHESLTKMVECVVADIDRDRVELLERLPDADAIEQYFSTTGDVMVVAIVSRGYTSQYRLHIELYVCRIERNALFEI